MTVSDKVFEILLALDRDGVIDYDEDNGTFEPVDATSKTWLHEMQQRFEKAGLALNDMTMGG